MRHEITKTENYLLILDNGSKEGDYIFHNNTIGKLVYNHYDDGDCYDVEIGTGVSYEIHEPLNIVKKIIAHLPLNNSSVLESVDSLPPSISQPKKPIAFECEYQSPEDRYYEDGVGYTHNVKRINNSQGQTQWVGKYIYA